MPDESYENWLPAPALPVLREGDAHVWRAILSDDAEEVRRLWKQLSADERERAERFRFEKDRARFVAARGRLREVLARYLDVVPSALVFRYSARGKPFLAEPESDIAFNLAHSRELAVYAFARGCEIGVDVEAIDEHFACLDVAPKVFTAEELKALRVLSGRDQTAFFFVLWTCKEALLKASGDGFFTDPTNICVTFCNGNLRMPVLTSVPEGAPGWSLRNFDAGDSYAAALATRPWIQRVQFFETALFPTEKT